MAAFTNQFERWPVVRLYTSLSGSKLVTNIGRHALLAMSEMLSDQRMSELCRAVEIRFVELHSEMKIEDEFDKFHIVYQMIERGFNAENGLPFGVKPEQVCAAIVFWKLADSMDCNELERDAQLAYAIDFLTLGVWLSTQYKTSEKDEKLMSKKAKLERKRIAIAAIQMRWKHRQAMAAYAKQLAQEKVWDSVEQAAGFIFPKIQAEFPDFKYKVGAVADWIRIDTPTVRKLKKAKSQI